MNWRLILFCFLVFAISAQVSRAETPTEAVDHVWNVYIRLDPKRTDNFPAEFSRLSQKVAQEQGVAVIAPIMVRSKEWKGEECLIFAMLVNSLPKAKSIPILEKYKQDGKPWEQQAAYDFLAEIEMASWDKTK